MTIAGIMIANHPEAAPVPVMPKRPSQPLSPWQLLRIGLRNTLEACDEQLFDELIVERRFLSYRTFVVSDPEGIRRVLQDNHENYIRLDQNRRMFHFDAGSGLLSADHETWQRHRHMLNPALDHRAAQLAAPMLCDLAARLVDQFTRSLPEADIDVADMATAWMTQAAGHVFAGEDRALDPMLLRMGVYPGRFSVFDFLPFPGPLRKIDRYREARTGPSHYFPVLDRMFAERRNPDWNGGKDLLWHLANCRDRNSGERLSLSEFRDEALTLGSTAATPVRPLTWIWYLLALFPEAETRLHAELDEVLGGALRPDDIGRLTYLRRVVDETMRLYPPLPAMFRLTREDDLICGRRIPRNSIVVVVPWVVHRHRRLWDHPDHFDPDRFSPERSASRSRYAYLPFSIGPHVCIGASLGMLQILIGAAALAQRLRFRLVRDFPVVPSAWTNLRPAHGIRMTVELREAGLASREPALAEAAAPG
jgi:cytochrome P450